MALEIKDLEIGYTVSKKNIRIKKIEKLTAQKGELIALIGSNGTGKSTLLRTLSRLQPAFNGEILLNGNDINKYSRADFAKYLAFVSTEIISVNNLKLFDLVALGRFPHTNWFGKLEESDKALINKSLETVGLLHYAQKGINEISDGEKQRAMIARTLAQDAEIIILDEPTAFLDLSHKYETVRFLNKLSRENNKTIIFSTHDLNIAIHEADKIWLMLPDNVYEGSPEDLVLNKHFSEIFKNRGMFFDELRGDFRTKKESKKKISFICKSDNSILKIWTEKALERLGFEIDNSEKNLEIILENSSKWIVKNNNKTQSFISIYELGNFLKNHQILETIEV